MSSFPPPPPPFGDLPPTPPTPPPPPPPITPPKQASGLSRKLAGLPVWGWLCIGLVVIVGVIGAVLAGGDDDGAKPGPDTTVVAPTLPDDTQAEPDDTTAPTITEPTPDDTDPAPDTTAVSEPDTEGEVAGSPAGKRGDRANPVAAGEIADIGGGWRLQVLGVTPDATAQIMEANEFNAPPPTGSTFTLINVALGYFGRNDPASAFGPTISAVGSANVELTAGCGSIPDELGIFTDVFAGGVLTGNLCFVTTPADIAGLQLYAVADFFADVEVFLEVATPTTATPLPGLKGPQPGATATPDRLAPTPIGTSVDVGEGWAVTVTGAARDITDSVMAENSFNEPPPAGYRFVGVEVTYAFSGSGSDSGFTVTTSAVGDTNVALGDDCGTIPTPLDQFTDVFAGGSVSGSLCFVVPEGSPQFTLYSSAAFGGDPIAFATT